jgi:hypothetical protein
MQGVIKFLLPVVLLGWVGSAEAQSRTAARTPQARARALLVAPENDARRGNYIQARKRVLRVFKVSIRGDKAAARIASGKPIEVQRRLRPVALGLGTIFAPDNARSKETTVSSPAALLRWADVTPP